MTEFESSVLQYLEWKKADSKTFNRHLLFAYVFTCVIVALDYFLS